MSIFRKRKVQKPIPGTRTSPQTGQVITSSGNPSMDVLLGGGLPIGSICLIEEDKYVTHSGVLAKYFLAEGIISRQAVFLGSLDDDPNVLLHNLPKPLMSDEVSKEEEMAKDEMDSNKNGLRIAWRYNDLPIVNSEQTPTQIGHHFNLLEKMDPRLLDSREITVWNDRTPHGATDDQDDDEDTFNADEVADLIAEADAIKDIEMGENVENVSDEQQAVDMEIDGNKTETPATPPPPPSDITTIISAQASTPIQAIQPSTKKSVKIFQNSKYMRILKDITGMLREEHFQSAPSNVNHYQKRYSNHSKPQLCRVCITSLASPLWYDTDFPKDIVKFLTLLRAAVRSSLAVCFITMPMHLVAKSDPTLKSKIRNLVDFCIGLESFAGSERETNPAYRDYSGLFHLHKISAINTLSAFLPETTDLAFKLRRKNFVIEKFHLPPELQESEKPGDDADLVSGNSCSAFSGAQQISAKYL